MTIRQIPQPIWKSAAFAVICDTCGSASQKNGADPGEASEFARKEGFITKTIDITLPLLWLCRTCQEAPSTHSKLNGQSKLNLSTLLQKGN
jgi:hypothetical protein